MEDDEKCPICGGPVTFGYGFAGGGLGGYTMCLADCGIITKHRTDEGECFHNVAEQDRPAESDSKNKAR